jgi:nucleoside-diphosphate-sugar epimerase
MSKILVIGGAGYIGGAISDIMEVSVFDNLMFEDRYLKPVEFYFGDVRDKDELLSKAIFYDTVVVLAGLVGDPACEVNKELTYDINVKHVKWLAENYPGKIVYTSSCSVYGKNDNLIDETAAPNPLSTYAESKLMCEEILKDRPESLIYRLGTLYGVGDLYSRPRLDLVVNVLTLKAVLNETLHVFGGDQWRPIINVKDVAEGIKFGIENKLSGIYNLSEKNVKILDLALDIVKLVPTEGGLEQTDMLFEDKRNYKVKADKIYNTGWKPKYDLQEGVLALAKMFKENRIKNIKDELYHNGNFMRKYYDN